MNNIILESEEDEGLDFEVETGDQDLDQDFNAKICLVRRFMVDGVIDFPSMKQMMTTLKEVDINLYLFQLYHEVDIKRVLDNSPCSFNQNALVVKE